MCASRLSRSSARRLGSALLLSLWLAPGLASAQGAPAATVPDTPPPLSISPAAGSPGSIRIGTASITYLTRAGDTLSAIARQFTDKPGNWIAIGKLNRIERDTSIPIGTPILIPGELLGDTPARATVVAMTGRITATDAAGGTTRLAPGVMIGEGVRIETAGNSFLTLSLADQSRISIPSQTRVQLAKLRTTRYINSPRTEVLLLRGKVESQVTPLEASRGRYEVRTPLSVAGVRGTHFRVGQIGDGAAGKIATETLDGKVAVATLRAAEAGAPDGLVLARGKGNLTDATTTGMSVDLLPAPRLADSANGRPEFSAAHIALIALPGAREYHLQIATDPEGVNLIAESRANVPMITIEGVTDGDYFARVSAIDRFGLEGFSHIEPISLRRGVTAESRGEDLRAVSAGKPGAPAVVGSDERSVTLRWQQMEGRSMRLQLARDSDFTYLLGSRLTMTGEARLPRPTFGTYYARVEVLDASGNIATFSAAQPFIVTDQWVINDGSPIAVKQSRATPSR